MSGALPGTLYAFVLVSAPSLRMLGRLRESLLALLPLVLALAWTIGLMHLFGIRFNLANIWGLPTILGISAEFGLNVMFRLLEGRAYGGPLLARSTVLGVVLYGLTTIVGFGSLLIAAHRGIFSLGLLLTIGCSTDTRAVTASGSTCSRDPRNRPPATARRRSDRPG